MWRKVDTSHKAFDEAEQAAMSKIDKMLNINGKKTVMELHQQLGAVMWDKVGIARSKENLWKAIDDIRGLREEFWNNLRLTGEKNTFNKYLEFAGRVADFLELGELMAVDALHRNESCGCHLREESQTPEGEALRNDDEYAYVAAWKYQGEDKQSELNKEPLKFENVKLTQRSYK